MAELISRHEYDVDVDFGGFALQDAGDRQVPARFPEGIQRGTFPAAHPGRLDFTSAGHTHTEAFTVEVWDAEPPVPPRTWEATATAGVFTSSERIPFPAHPGNWSVRARG